MPPTPLFKCPNYNHFNKANALRQVVFNSFKVFIAWKVQCTQHISAALLVGMDVRRCETLRMTIEKRWISICIWFRWHGLGYLSKRLISSPHTYILYIFNPYRCEHLRIQWISRQLTTLHCLSGGCRPFVVHFPLCFHLEWDFWSYKTFL